MATRLTNTKGEHMDGLRLEVTLDLYSYPGKDDELISLFNKVGRFNKKPVFIWLANIALERSFLDISDLYINDSRHTRVENAEIFRFKLYRHNDEKIIDLWEQLPRGSKSPVFIALIKQALKDCDGKIPIELLMGTCNENQNISNKSDVIEETSTDSNNQRGMTKEAKTVAYSLMYGSMEPFCDDMDEPDED